MPSPPRVRLLMCRPDFFEVRYVINPWMDGNVGRSAQDAARSQWQALHGRLGEVAQVELIEPRPGLPDMVFTANAGVTFGNRAILGRFLYRERQPEEAHFREWFTGLGFDVFEMPPDLPFEGAGDALLDREGGWMWIAYGLRTELDAHPLVARWLDVEVCSLRLIDPRFYHLDTCFCPLEGGWLMYHPPAFDAASNRLIEARVPSERRIPVSAADAAHFACNAINIGQRIFLNHASPELKAALAAAGHEVVETPLTEFMKAGGAAKCLALCVGEPRPSRASAACEVQSDSVHLEGHLLDSGLLDRALDVIVDGGGSFRVMEFRLGRQRQSTSRAEIHVSAPSSDALGKLMARLADLGATAVPREEADAQLETVTGTGVAPEDFYATTIYPTEVRVGGRWIPVQDQRMDGVVVIRGEGDSAEARCTIFRRLEPGDRVVIGGAGIRRVRRVETREDRPAIAADFAFMGERVSSERRVGLAVERVAWQMHQIRGQGGRIVAVAGPVVVHTGGADRLAWLVREGYVQALLAGNGLAVHDIEQAMFGTSLGVDARLGAGVRGGHRNHLRAINAIRRCGGIAQAVRQGVLESGIFYECIRRDVPFALAASIRDDGPLPDTLTDMIRAQDEYARHIKGADMILMLGSMLHSIGSGNMTPAGVKMVCVDINPAVVTKLADRGSVLSSGVVADVGSFLSLLVERLRHMESGPMLYRADEPMAV
ncbi:MAG TPA: TIGR00300 family protein [Verrucomicrobiae bacterium]|nr:TIGR00300 family protein [Verrucomicrobiae bacterium]